MAAPLQSADSKVLGKATGDDKMDSDVETIRSRLKSLFTQLQTECAILERIVHKNKNQHRRSGYFQYLLKVRRDLRLLQSVKLEQLSALCFQVLTDEKPRQKIQLLESLKRRKCDRRKPNFLEQLLGAARLLSQVIEPMLKAAGIFAPWTLLNLFDMDVKDILDHLNLYMISILLAQSFFMGFSLTILSLLARLRVLVQQILVDVVSIFNMVSSLSQKRHSVKIIQEGVEVFREFYPFNEDSITLECIWKSDKFVLVEKMLKAEVTPPVKDLDITDSSLQAPSIRYESIESFLEDEEPDSVAKLSELDKSVTECSDQTIEDKAEVMVDPDPPREDDTIAIEPTPECKSSADVASVASSTSTSLQILEPLKVKSGTEPKRVAFLSVQKPSPSNSKCVEIPSQDAHKNDPFFNLLTSGNLLDSLF